MASGYTMLTYINKHNDLYDALEKKGAAIEEGIRNVISRKSYPVSVNRVGSMFTLFFTDKVVNDFETASSSDRDKFAAYFGSMLEQGIYIPPSQFEAAFISTAHTDGDIEQTLSAVEVALEKVFG